MNKCLCVYVCFYMFTFKYRVIIFNKNGVLIFIFMIGCIMNKEEEKKVENKNEKFQRSIIILNHDTMKTIANSHTNV
jgi:hypothetical protein